jgi:hypothetical protein
MLRVSEYSLDRVKFDYENCHQVVTDWNAEK